MPISALRAPLVAKFGMPLLVLGSSWAKNRAIRLPPVQIVRDTKDVDKHLRNQPTNDRHYFKARMNHSNISLDAQWMCYMPWLQQTPCPLLALLENPEGTSFSVGGSHCWINWQSLSVPIHGPMDECIWLLVHWKHVWRKDCFMLFVPCLCHFSNAATQLLWAMLCLDGSKLKAQAGFTCCVLPSSNCIEVHNLHAPRAGSFCQTILPLIFKLPLLHPWHSIWLNIHTMIKQLIKGIQSTRGSASGSSTR